MPVFAQALDLRDDPSLIEAYRRHHRAVWPEVLDALRAIGVRHMRIWLVGTRLFMTYEAPEGFEPARDFQRYAENSRSREWDEWMRSFQRRLAEARDGEWWTPMELVFDLESAIGGERAAPTAR